jgi:rhodanese-related sulfurtransferase
MIERIIAVSLALGLVLSGTAWGVGLSNQNVQPTPYSNEAIHNKQALNQRVQAKGAKQQPSALYIDVRSWLEYQTDGIAGHAHIHYPDISSEIGQYAQSKDQTIYVYCAVGGRAEKARQSLIENGYSDVVNLGGVEDVKNMISDDYNTE